MTEKQIQAEAQQAEKTAAAHRKIQAKIDAKPKQDKASQKGTRDYPVPPFKKQHQTKPGSEEILDPAPIYMTRPLIGGYSGG